MDSINDKKGKRFHSARVINTKNGEKALISNSNKNNTKITPDSGSSRPQAPTRTNEENMRTSLSP